MLLMPHRAGPACLQLLAMGMAPAWVAAAGLSTHRVSYIHFLFIISIHAYSSICLAEG